MNNKKKYIVCVPLKQYLKGESLNRIIDYYVITNYSSSDFIEDKEYKELINKLELYIKSKK
jgi:hypothetical protein